MDYTYRQIAKMIDHSLLSPILVEEALRDGGLELDKVVNIGKVLSGDPE